MHFTSTSGSAPPIPALAAVVQTTPSGYRLDYGKVEVDADRFETLVETAKPLVDADPLAALPPSFRERLTALPIGALQQEGRTVESLEVYLKHAALIQRGFGAALSPGIRSPVGRVR